MTESSVFVYPYFLKKISGIEFLLWISINYVILVTLPKMVVDIV